MQDLTQGLGRALKKEIDTATEPHHFRDILNRHPESGLNEEVKERVRARIEFLFRASTCPLTRKYLEDFLEDMVDLCCESGAKRFFASRRYNRYQ